MQSTELLNIALYRELRNEYPQDIFPAVHCKTTDLGYGDTFFSVEQIAIMINTYYKQCKKIAPKLKSNSFEQTLRNIHYFGYWHFQYSADWQIQQLRSPACSWKQRRQGIDCKSYTILIGSILKVLGINFYIRQIKQWGVNPDDFSHVYVVVPINQKTNDLSKGYYIIDATLPTMEEIHFKDKADFLVMKHIALNGAYNPAVGLKAIQVGGYGYQPTSTGNNSAIYQPLPSVPSVPTFQKKTSLEKAQTILGLFNMVGDTTVKLILANKGIGTGANATQIPQNVVTKEDLVEYIKHLGVQNTQQSNTDLLNIFMALQGQKKDYTPYIIGGAILLISLGAIMFMSSNSNKK